MSPALLLSIFANNILPILLVAGVGYLAARYLRTDVKTLSRIVFNALTPCLVFNLLVTSKMQAAELGQMALFAVLAVLGIGLIARLVTLPLKLEPAIASAFVIVVMFSNAGNYGLSVNMFAFGNEALARASIYFVTSSVLMYTVGVFLASSGRRSVREALVGIFRVPAVYAVFIALGVMAAGVAVPQAIMRPVTLLSNAALPIMMLVLGMQLERSAIPERPWLVVLAALITLIVSPLLAFGLVELLGISGVARQAAIIEAAMPTAVVTTILALEYEIAPSFVTGVVFVSTLASPITITVLIALLQQ